MGDFLTYDKAQDLLDLTSTYGMRKTYFAIQEVVMQMTAYRPFSDTRQIGDTIPTQNILEMDILQSQDGTLLYVRGPQLITLTAKIASIMQSFR